MSGIGIENLRNLINSFLPWLVSIVSAAGLTVDPFTNTLDIDPAVVQSSATGAFKMAKITGHWSVATSNPVTISLDSAQGVAYDTVLAVVLMGAVQDMTVDFAASDKYEAGDVITVAWTDDTGGTATWGIRICWEN